MFKILLGNVLFAGCVTAWYFYADGDHGLVLSGTILAFGCFLSGILMGYLLRSPGKARRRAAYRSSSRPFDASSVLADEMEQEEAEAEVEPLEPEPAIDSDPVEEEVEPPIVIAAPVQESVEEPVEVEIFEEIVPAFSEIPSPPISVPQMAPSVEIHEPAAKVVLDSDGCYEMVVRNEPAPFIPADDGANIEKKGIVDPPPSETETDTAEFKL